MLSWSDPAPQRTLEYGSEPDNVIDLWVPPGAARLVVLLHGGFWRAGVDRKHLRPLAGTLVDRGYAVALPEFRRSGQPGGGWPGTFDDAAACLDLLPELLARYELSRVVWAGHSAGGHLALWAACRHHLSPDSPWYRVVPPDIRGIAALAPVSELIRCSEQGLGEGAADALMGGTPAERPERYAAGDPLGLLPLPVPVTIVHGTRDQRVPIEMSRDYAGGAGRVGSPVELVEVPGADHFALVDPSAPAARQVHAAIDALAGNDAAASS